MNGEHGLTQPPPHRVRKLNSLKGVREEMVSVYRAARKGEMKTEEMSRFVFALRCIAQVIEHSDLEARMAAIEQAVQERDAQPHHPPYTH